MLPIVEQLANPALKDRHWRAVLALLGADKAVSRSPSDPAQTDNCHLPAAEMEIVGCWQLHIQ